MYRALYSTQSNHSVVDRCASVEKINLPLERVFDSKSKILFELTSVLPKHCLAFHRIASTTALRTAKPGVAD